MSTYRCPDGHTWQGLSTMNRRFHPSEASCPECGGRAAPSLKQSSGRRNGVQATEPRVVADAHLRFSQLVTEWPCWARSNRPGHRCWGPIDPHHLVPATWIRQTFGDLPDDELAAILYEPAIGAPLCRAFHQAVEDRNEIIAWHELDDEAKLFCQRVDERYPGRPSMLERLRLESPAREVAG